MTDALSDENNIITILDSLDISYRYNGKVFVSECPIHGGDNPTALNIFQNHNNSYLWKCHTHACQDKHGKWIFDFIKTLLNINDENTTKYICKILNIKNLDIPDLKINRELLKLIDISKNEITTDPQFIDKECLSRLDIPADYYINRGYTRDILLKYEIGFPKNGGTGIMKDRVVVPIYDSQKNNLLGFSARTIRIPTAYNPKWIHYKFKKTESLYNSWFLDNNLNKLIIVESPGNIWRLVEAGINNCVAIFGNRISELQCNLIIDTFKNLEELIIITDNDINNAGECLYNSIMENSNLPWIFRIKRYNLPKNIKDVAELEIEKHSEEFKKIKCLI